MATIKNYFVNDTYREFEENDPDFIKHLEKLLQMGFEGKELIDTLITDDWGAPPLTVKLEGTNSKSENINLSVPYNYQIMIRNEH